MHILKRKLNLFNLFSNVCDQSKHYKFVWVMLTIKGVTKTSISVSDAATSMSSIVKKFQAEQNWLT